MNKQEPYPITTQMMWIAMHPAHPWLDEHIKPKAVRTNKKGEPELIVDSKKSRV